MVFCAGEVFSVLARPGLLDLREYPCVGGGLHRAGGLHHPQVLRAVGEATAAPGGFISVLRESWEKSKIFAWEKFR